MKKKTLWICAAVLILLVAAVILIPRGTEGEEPVPTEKPVETVSTPQPSPVKASPEPEEAVPESLEVDNSQVRAEDLTSSNVRSARINEEGHLVLTLETGEDLDQGYVGGTLEEDSCVVTFLNLDHSVLKVEIVKKGEDAVPPADPSAPGYVFYGWSGEYRSVSGDTVVSAVYFRQGEYYSVTYLDHDGREILIERVPAGKDASGPAEDPVRQGYTFAGWDHSLSTVTENLSVNARYIPDGEPVLALGMPEARPGEKNVPVTIDLKNNPGICSLKLKLSFDPSLTLSSYTFHTEELGGSSVGPETVPLQGEATFLWFKYDGDITEDFPFVTLYFDVAQDAAGRREITLSYDPDDIFNVQNENVEVGIINGAIRIKD